MPTPPAGLCQHAWRRGEPGWELLGTRQPGQPCLALACRAGAGTRVPPPAGFSAQLLPKGCCCPGHLRCPAWSHGSSSCLPLSLFPLQLRWRSQGC